MVVLSEVFLQVFYILSHKLTLKAAEGLVALQVMLNLCLCAERHSAGPDSAGNKRQTMGRRQVGLILLTHGATELTAGLSAGEWALRVTSTVDASEVAFQDSRAGECLTALRTLVALCLCCPGWSGEFI